MNIYSEDEPDWRPKGPGLSHFRSSNIKEVAITVQQKWKLCLSGGTILPIKRLKKFDEEGNFQTFQQMELFSESEVEESMLQPAVGSTSEVPAFPEIDIVNEEYKEVCTSLTVVNMEEYCLGGDADMESTHQEPESLELVCEILYNTFSYYYFILYL